MSSYPLPKVGDKIRLTNDDYARGVISLPNCLSGNLPKDFSSYVAGISLPGIIRFLDKNGSQWNGLWMQQVFPDIEIQVGTRVMMSPFKNTLEMSSIDKEDICQEGTIRDTFSERSWCVELDRGDHIRWWCEPFVHAFPIPQVQRGITRSRPGYCDCTKPLVIKAFTGIAGGGESYMYCTCCKKERVSFDELATTKY